MSQNVSIRGLSEEEVAHSALTYGTNQLSQKKRKSFFASLLSNFSDPMILILTVALLVNVGLLIVQIVSEGFEFSQLLEPIGIAFAVLIAVVVSTVSEYGSESAFKKLSQEASKIFCRVKREAGTQKLPISQIVVGDIVILQSGDKIPADGIIVSGKIEVDQSSLNGESEEAKKNALGRQESEKKEEGDFLNPLLLFGGTVVTSGECLMRVTSVGDKTFYGKLATELQENPPDSPLKAKLKKLAKSISVFGYTGAALAAVAYLFNAVLLQNNFDPVQIGQSFNSASQVISLVTRTVTLAVTIIVMAVPEGLPMMITVVLSSNMRRMLKDKVLVRKLSGIETAGSMNILFTDKTGTLTMGKPEVVCVVTGEGKKYQTKDKSDLKGQDLSGQYLDVLSLSLAANNGAEVVEGRVEGGNLTDRALLNFAQKITVPAYQKLSVIPFNSAEKYMATQIILSGPSQLLIGFSNGKNNFAQINTGQTKPLNGSNLIKNGDSAFDPTAGTTLWLVKGAPEKILNSCNFLLDKQGKIVPLTGKEILKKSVADLGKKAIRVLALAISFDTIVEGKPFSQLCFVSLMGIRDSIREEAVIGVGQVKSAGIQVVMMTGDALDTAVAVALDTGILSKDFNQISLKDNKELVITSDQMAQLSDEQLSRMLPDLRVVARSLPQDKSRLVKIAQSLNLVTGMTGDGVNDAPALKKADIGFGMGSGTEVAKEASDVVILDDNILSIAKAVSYGRTIFKSIRKFIIFQLSSNIAAIFISIVAPFIGRSYPITVIQILWMNLIMDTLAGLAFAGEKPRQKYMQEPPKKRTEGIINKYMFSQILVGGAFTAAVSIWFLTSNWLKDVFEVTNGVIVTGGATFELYYMAAFFVLFMFMAFFNTLNVRTHELNLLRNLKSNKVFIFIIASVMAVQVFVTYFGGEVFRTTPLWIGHFAIVLALSLTIIPIDLLRKLILKKLKAPMGT
ncbi:MAG: cation-transporting P-type ATPase [Firmicutes bacterium]|nr:cation-transporting P-type ATPase [Bacillota bacterium]